PVRKEVAGYDLKSLLIGSEGTLGVVTGIWLALLPAPERVLPVVGVYPTTRAGCAAIEAVYGSGVRAATLEYVDAGALLYNAATLPMTVPAGAAFLVIAEADGSAEAAERVAGEL